MKDFVCVTSQRKTEFNLPCVGACLRDFIPTEEQQIELDEELSSIAPLIEGDVRQRLVTKNSSNLIVYFFLPNGVSNVFIWEMKRELAKALEKSGMVKKAEVVANINPRLCSAN